MYGAPVPDIPPVIPGSPELGVAESVCACTVVERFGNKNIEKIINAKRGDKKRMIEFALRNAVAALERYHVQKLSEDKVLSGVADLFSLDAPPQRIVDQGCGTGLNAEVFAQHVGLIDGIEHGNIIGAIA